MADATCPQSAVVDVMLKSALVGAVAYVAYAWAVNEGVIGHGFGSRAARYAAGRAKSFFVRG